MRVNIKYTSKITIDKELISVYITDDSVVYVGMQIVPYIESKQQIKQLIITDIDDKQYMVYPLVEVCRYIREGLKLEMNTTGIALKEHQEVKGESSEFELTLKNIMKPKK